jgi:chromosome segregation ATPase
MLKTTRKELVDTITELNTIKQDLRKALVTIVQKDEEIAGLKQTLQQKSEEIAGLNSTVRQKDDQLADLNKTVTLKNQEIDIRDTKIKQQAQTIVQLEGTIEQMKGPTGTGKGEEAEARRVPPGDKGTVISVDSEWKFCVLSLSQKFFEEMLGPDMSFNVPIIHLLVRKPGGKGMFAAKVRLIQVDVKKRLAVANIMSDWEQIPVEPGDIVYY